VHRFDLRHSSRVMAAVRDKMKKTSAKTLFLLVTPSFNYFLSQG
jgi:hypothetical protein